MDSPHWVSKPIQKKENLKFLETRDQTILWGPEIRAGIYQYTANESLHLLQSIKLYTNFKKAHLKTRNRGRPILLLEEIIEKLLKQ